VRRPQHSHKEEALCLNLSLQHFSAFSRPQNKTYRHRRGGKQSRESQYVDSRTAWFIPRSGHGILGAGLAIPQVGRRRRTITLRPFYKRRDQNTGGTLEAPIQGEGFFTSRVPHKGTAIYPRWKLSRGQGWKPYDHDGESVRRFGPCSTGVLNTNAPTRQHHSPVGTVENLPFATRVCSFDMNLLERRGRGGNGCWALRTSVTVFDSLGNSAIVTASVTKDPTTDGQWNY